MDVMLKLSCSSQHESISRCRCSVVFVELCNGEKYDMLPSEKRHQKHQPCMHSVESAKANDGHWRKQDAEFSVEWGLASKVHTAVRCW